MALSFKCSLISEAVHESSDLVHFFGVDWSLVCNKCYTDCIALVLHCAVADIPEAKKEGQNHFLFLNLVMNGRYIHIKVYFEKYILMFIRLTHFSISL